MIAVDSSEAFRASGMRLVTDPVATCKCRKGAWDPACPKHGKPEPEPCEPSPVGDFYGDGCA